MRRRALLTLPGLTVLLRGQQKIDDALLEVMVADRGPYVCRLRANLPTTLNT